MSDGGDGGGGGDGSASEPYVAPPTQAQQTPDMSSWFMGPQDASADPLAATAERRAAVQRALTAYHGPEGPSPATQAPWAQAAQQWLDTTPPPAVSAPAPPPSHFAMDSYSGVQWPAQPHPNLAQLQGPA